MRQELKRGRKNQVGALGEQIAARYLQEQGLKIIDRNYLKKWGEIDIVARGTSNEVHFVEVKTVSYETKADLEGAVLRGTWRPEEQVHHKKLARLHRAIETWLLETCFGGAWQVDIVSVRVVPREKYATVAHIANVTEG